MSDNQNISYLQISRASFSLAYTVTSQRYKVSPVLNGIFFQKPDVDFFVFLLLSELLDACLCYAEQTRFSAMQ